MATEPEYPPLTADMVVRAYPTQIIGPDGEKRNVFAILDYMPGGRKRAPEEEPRNSK